MKDSPIESCEGIRALNAPTGLKALKALKGLKAPKALKGLKALGCKTAIALFVLAILAIYAQTICFSFLRFDDPDYTFACPFVKDGLSWSGIREAFRNARHGAVWMPLTWLSYMADRSFLGPGAGSHHAVNVLLHLVNTFLLLRLACSVHRNMSCGCSAFIVLLVAFWAIHPQRVEAVAWIASRKELLWAFFALLGLLAWRAGYGLVACVCCALACMSKPTAMVFPVLALLVGSGEGGKKLESCGELRPLRPLPPLRYLTLMFGMAVATGALAVYSQTHPEGMAAKDLFYAPLVERLLNAVVAVGLYLAQMVVPVGIHLDYRAVPGGLPPGGVVGLAVFTALLILFLVKVPKVLKVPKSTAAIDILKAVLFFTAALLPTIGLFGSFGEHARADRFLYVPSMAIPLFLPFLIPAVLKAPKFKAFRIPEVFCFAVLALFACQSFRLTATYREDLSAFTRTLACDPDHGRALAHVGEAKCAANSLDEGIEMLRRSRSLRPRDATDGKLAYALMRRGRSADWAEIREVCAPFAADPARDRKGQALEALGTAELKSRNWSKAAEYLLRSILAPTRFYSAADARLKLAYAWHNAGRHADARKLFESISASSRMDLASRADEVLSVLDSSPNAMLFW